VDRIPAAAEQARLRSIAIERNAEREHLAGADKRGGLDDVLRLDVVEGSDLVVRAPATPVLELLRGLRDRLLVDGDIHGRSLRCAVSIGRGILARATAKVYTSPACAAVRLRIQPLHFSRRHARIRHRHRRGMAGEPGRKRT